MNDITKQLHKVDHTCIISNVILQKTRAWEVAIMLDRSYHEREFKTSYIACIWRIFIADQLSIIPEKCKLKSVIIPKHPGVSLPFIQKGQMTFATGLFTMI